MKCKERISFVRKARVLRKSRLTNCKRHNLFVEKAYSDGVGFFKLYIFVCIILKKLNEIELTVAIKYASMKDALLCCSMPNY